MSVNRTRARTARAALLTGALLGTGTIAFAAVPVVESVPDGQRAYQGSAAAAAQPGSGDARAGDASQLTELFYQLQVLQREVQDLRGTVEEQRHRLDRLARDQQEQYLDLDRRMQALRGGGGPAAGPAGPGPAGPGPGVSGGPAMPPFQDEPPAPAFGTAPGSEREAYAAAFELMKQRQFDQSVNAFKRLVADYPNGAYTPNAFYWLGELYLAQEQNELARQSFAQVVNLYPDHQKVPDALYKLGVVYHRLGDVERAREYLNRVISDYPDSSAAGLARTYLGEL